jgi:hypothetical protein
MYIHKLIHTYIHTYAVRRRGGGGSSGGSVTFRAWHTDDSEDLSLRWYIHSHMIETFPGSDSIPTYIIQTSIFTYIHL